MSIDEAMTAIVGGLIGYSAAQVLIRARLHSPAPPTRINYRGIEVPVVLGGPLAIGALFGLGSLSVLAALGWREARAGSVAVAVAVVIVVMWFAGRWDDRKGDERPRGFSGHLAAARSGALTGGLVKLVAGGVCGIAAGAMVSSSLRAVAEIALLVALSANLVNLFDRAPGRAAKVSIVMALPLLATEPGPWAIAASSTLGAVLACLPYDLSEKAMLGDAGANPLGAVIGLGFFSAPEPVRLVLIGVLAAANIASERWSFSSAIENNRVLGALDRLGRRRSEPPPRRPEGP